MNILLESLNSLRRLFVFSQYDDVEPDEEDVFIQDERGKTSAWQGGKEIATLRNTDYPKFYKEILDWMNRSKFWPTVWYVDDHGGQTVDTDFISFSKRHRGKMAAEGELYSRVGPSGDLEEPDYKEIAHEEMRIGTMSIDALRTRIRKIGKPEKMYAFIYALEKQVDIYGPDSQQGKDYKELADAARNYLKIWGYDKRGRVMAEKERLANASPEYAIRGQWAREAAQQMIGVFGSYGLTPEIRGAVIEVIDDYVNREIDQAARKVEGGSAKDVAQALWGVYTTSAFQKGASLKKMDEGIKKIFEAVDEVFKGIAQGREE